MTLLGSRLTRVRPPTTAARERRGARAAILRTGAGVIGVAATALAACGSTHGPTAAPATTTAPPPARAAAGYPDSFAALGHSGLTGEDSDPHRPHVDIKPNSWATGANPAVNSIYLRLLAHNPAIKDRNYNFAMGGATVLDLVDQATQAVAVDHLPQLFVIQIMDNDIVCPLSQPKLAQFGRTFRRALRVITKGAPKAKIFVVSQFGGVGTYAAALTPAQRRSLGGRGPCDFIDPAGRPVPRKAARLKRAIRAYQAQLKTQCERLARCRYDGGAFNHVLDRAAYLAEDLKHISVQGAAKAAAVAWAAMQRTGIVPRS